MSEMSGHLWDYAIELVQKNYWLRGTFINKVAAKEIVVAEMRNRLDVARVAGAPTPAHAGPKGVK